MAVAFKNIVIGGQDGIPFPNYSISSEAIMSEDESILGTKFNIKITGQIIAVGDIEVESGGGSINVGERQDNLHSQINGFLALARGGTQSGRLEIDPYGGLPNKIEFLAAKLTSIEIPDQDEESSGILYANYSFTFEAYEDTHISYSILSAEETWDLSTEESTTYSPNVQGSVYKVYTVSHTVSAKGRKKFDEDSIVANGDAWKQAQLFVNSKLLALPDDVPGSLFGENSANYDPIDIDLSQDLRADGYGYYNHIRIPSCNIGAGTYSITDTWTASKVPAIVDMENNHDLDASGITSITLSGTITGLSSGAVTSNVIERITAAEDVLAYIEANAFTIANLSFSPSACESSLLNYPVAKSIGKNKGSGTITFSYTYNNNYLPSELIDGGVPVVTSYSLDISDDNEDGENVVVAIIPIILKLDGPVIQDMGTTNEKKRSLQLSMGMNKCNRSSKPYSRIEPIVTANKPSATNVYRESKTESWNPVTGEYSLSIGWVY